MSRESPGASSSARPRALGPRPTSAALPGRSAAAAGAGADHSAAPARRPALLRPRRDGAAQHRVEHAGSACRRRWAASAARTTRHDPTDLGPLVPLPGGFAEVFEYLASVGVSGLRVLPVDAERQRARPAAHGGRDPVVPRQRRPRRAGDAPVRPGQPRRADRELFAADPPARRPRRARTCSPSCRRSG